MHERKEARIHVHEDPERFRRIFSEARCISLQRCARAGLTYAESSPRMTFFAPVIYPLLPNSRFLFVHRHPGEVVRSGMRRGWYEGHAADPARIVPTDAEMPASEWLSLTSFQKICWYWDTYIRFSREFVRSVGTDRVFELDATKLFDGSAVGELFVFLGLGSPNDGKVKEVLSTTENAQTEREFPRYRDWTPEMRADLVRFAGESMRALGYE